MKTLITLAVALAFAGQALADVNYDLGKAQAKRAVNQTEAAQGNAPSDGTPAQPQTPAAPAAPPADPALAAALQNIADLRADLDALSQAADAQAGADQRVSLLNHFSVAGAPGKRASVASIKKLAAHLITATSGRNNLKAQNAKLARDLHSLFNSAHLSATEQQAVLDRVKKILTDAGAAADDVDNVITDLKQVATETQ